MTSETKTRTGQCLCGTIKYELSGPAATPLYNTVCHCLNCRRTTGSALYTASICPQDGFHLTHGTPSQKTYLDTSTSSGNPLTRVFCSVCGTKLFALTPLNTSIISIAAGTLDDFDTLPWKPDTEQWCMHRAGFVEKMKSVEESRRFDGAVKQ